MEITKTMGKKGLDRLDLHIARINKRAEKLNMKPVTREVIREWKEQEDPDGIKLKQRFEVKITGETPFLAGWKFLGVVEHLYGEEAGNIVHSMRDVEIPEKYRTGPATCDHCRVNMARNKTFILKNEAGDFKQVGSSCLVDFTGSDVNVGNLEHYFFDFEGFFREEFFEDEDDVWGCGGFGGGRDFLNLERILAIGAAFIRIEGFVPKSRATANGYCTSVGVENYLECRYPGAGYTEPKELKMFDPTENDKETAKKTIEWIRGLTELHSEYLYNLSVIFRGEACHYRHLGFAISGIAAYFREIGRKAESGKISKHFGTVGERGTYILTVTKLFCKESQWGITTILSLIDAAGNQAVWFASKEPNVEIGKTYKIKATIKEHGNFKGVPQTVITRGNILGEEADAKTA